MQENNNTSDTETVSAPTWDSSQLYLRAWLDDIAAWLPSQHAYSTFVEYGYVRTSQGSVAAYRLEHALHCRSRLLVAHTFDSPSPRNPVFASQGSTAPANLQATTRQKRSQAQSAPAQTNVSSAAPVAAPVSTSGLPPLTADEAKRYFVAPELIDATDRKMMTFILRTITCQAAQRTHALTCDGSGRELLRLLAASEANAASTATSATISAMLHSHEVRGISEPSVTAFNVFVHTIQRLNRSLPSSAKLPDTVLSEKIANAVRRLSDSISTLLDVKLALVAGVGNLALTISAARGVLSDAEARNMRRELESNPGSLHAFAVRSKEDRARPADPKRPRPEPDK
eukprot:3393193-Pleurochrysis_carterae.AAC.1